VNAVAGPHELTASDPGLHRAVIVEGTRVRRTVVSVVII